MVTQFDPADQAVFRALADPTRRAIIELLAEAPMTASDVAGRFDISRPAVAKHLKVLAEGDVIEVRQKGRERISSLKPQSLKRAAQWLAYFDRFWDARLENLKSVVEDAEND